MVRQVVGRCTRAGVGKEAGGKSKVVERQIRAAKQAVAPSRDQPDQTQLKELVPYRVLVLYRS